MINMICNRKKNQDSTKEYSDKLCFFNEQLYLSHLTLTCFSTWWHDVPHLPVCQSARSWGGPQRRPHRTCGDQRLIKHITLLQSALLSIKHTANLPAESLDMFMLYLTAQMLYELFSFCFYQAQWKMTAIITNTIVQKFNMNFYSQAWFTAEFITELWIRG